MFLFFELHPSSLGGILSRGFGVATFFMIIRLLLILIIKIAKICWGVIEPRFFYANIVAREKASLISIDKDTIKAIDKDTIKAIDKDTIKDIDNDFIKYLADEESDNEEFWKNE